MNVRNSFFTNINISPEYIVNGSLVFWLYRLYFKIECYEKLEELFQRYLILEYENEELNNQAFSFFLRSRKNKLLNELVAKKTKKGFHVDLVAGSFDDVYAINKFDCFSTEFLEVLFTKLHRKEDISCLCGELLKRANLKNGTLRLLIKECERQGDIASLDRIDLMLKSHGIHGRMFYYRLIVLIETQGELSVIEYLKDNNKNYLYEKYTFLKEVYKRVRKYNDSYLYEYFLRHANISVDDNYISKTSIEYFSKSNIEFSEFIQYLNTVKGESVDRLQDLLTNECPTEKAQLYLTNNYLSYPFISSYVLEYLYDRGVWDNENYGKSLDYLIIRKYKYENKCIVNLMNIDMFTFNADVWTVLKETKYSILYLEKCTASENVDVAKYQINKKNGNSAECLKIAKQLVECSSDRKKMRHMLRVSESLELMGCYTEATEYLSSISSKYFPANEFLITRDITISPELRLKKLSDCFKNVYNKSDLVRYKKIEFKLLLESKSFTKLGKFMDDITIWNSECLSDLELRNLFVLTYYFIYEKYSILIEFVDDGQFTDKVSLLYKGLSALKCSDFEAASQVVNASIDYDDIDFKLFEYNFYLKNNERVKSKQIFEGVVGGNIKSENKFTVDNVRFERGAVYSSKELVTVVMTNFGFSEFVETSIKSILDQTYVNLELIIVDDCSSARDYQKLTDLCKYISDDRIQVIRAKKNGGTYSAKNIGLKLAKGDYITFQDSDDYSHPDRLEFQYKHLKSSNCLANTVQCFRIGDDEQVYFYRSGAVKKAPISLMLDKKVLSEIGYFNSIRVGADSEFLNRFNLVYGKSKIVDLSNVLYLASYHAQSLTSLGKTSLHPILGIVGLRAKSKMAYMQWHGEIRSGKSAFVGVEQVSFDAPTELLS